jgi:hypothetical protein
MRLFPIIYGSSKVPLGSFLVPWSQLSLTFISCFFSTSRSRFFSIFTRIFAFLGRIIPYLILKTAYFLSTLLYFLFDWCMHCHILIRKKIISYFHNKGGSLPKKSKIYFFQEIIIYTPIESPCRVYMKNYVILNKLSVIRTKK